MDIVTPLEAARNQTLRYFDLSDEQLDIVFMAARHSSTMRLDGLDALVWLALTDATRPANIQPYG